MLTRPGTRHQGIEAKRGPGQRWGRSQEAHQVREKSSPEWRSSEAFQINLLKDKTQTIWAPDEFECAEKDLGKRWDIKNELDKYMENEAKEKLEN